MSEDRLITGLPSDQDTMQRAAGGSNVIPFNPAALQLPGDVAAGPPSPTASPIPDYLKPFYQKVTGGESGGKNVLYGGAPVPPGNVIPGSVGPDGRPTHAFGPAQMEPATWNRAAAAARAQGKILNKDNPADYQWAVLYTARRDYAAKGGDLDTDAKAGKIDYSKLSSTWTSLQPQVAQHDSMSSANPELQRIAGDTNKLFEQMQQMNLRDPETSKLLRETREKMLEYQQKSLDASQKFLEDTNPNPRDFMQRLGGLGTVVGLLGGLLTKSPLTASLNAGAAAMEAYNKQDETTYKFHLDAFKFYNDSLRNMAQFEQNAYRDILEDDRMTRSEQMTRVQMMASLLQNERMVAAAQNGDAERVMRMNMEAMRANQAHEDRMLTFWAKYGSAGIGGSGGEKLETSKMYDVVDEKGKVIRTVMAREKKNEPGFIDAETGLPLQLGDGQHLKQITPSTSGGGRAGAQVIRQEVGGREVLSDLQNAVNLPVGTTTGMFGTFVPGTSALGALHGDLVRSITSQDSQLMQASMASMTRELSILMSPVYGGNWAAQQIDPLVPKSGDTLGTVLFKLARLAQSADNALEAVSKSPILSNEQQQYALSLREQIGDAIPWTPKQAMDFARKGDTGQSFGDFIKAKGISGSGIPPEAIAYLRQHPEARDQFDAKYGSGSAERALAQ